MQPPPELPYYLQGQAVTVTAFDGGGYRFVGWGGTVSGAANPLHLVMQANHEISAYSSLNREPMFVTFEGEGTVTKDPDFPEYQSVIAVDILGATQVTARFEPALWTLALEQNGLGYVEVSPALDLYPGGTEVTLFASDNDGNTFNGVGRGRLRHHQPADGCHEREQADHGVLVGHSSHPGHRRNGRRRSAPGSRLGVLPCRIRVLDVQGREIARLADMTYPPGRHQVRWQARIASRADGLYFIELQAGATRIVRRVVLNP